MKVGDVATIAGCTGTVAYISRPEYSTTPIVRDGWQVITLHDDAHGAVHMSIALSDCDCAPKTGEVWRDDDGDAWTVNYSQPAKIDNNGQESHGHMIYMYMVPGFDACDG